MAVPFGISVGDFIAAIGVAVKITEALQDSGGAASEYQSITRDLANLQAALIKIDSAQTGNNSPISGTIYEQTKVVKESAQELSDGLSKFEKKLGDKAKTGWKYGTGRKIQFAVLQSKEIAKAKSVIHDQVQNLTVLNLLQILEVVQKLDQSQQDLSQTVSDKIEASKSEFQESQKISSQTVSDKIEASTSEIQESQRNLSQTISKKIETSKSEIQDLVSQIFSAKDARFDDIVSELKLSLGVLQSGMQTGYDHSITEIKLLGDTVRDILDRATDSSSQLHQIMDREGKLRVELSRLCESIERIQSAISKKSLLGSTELQLSTLDVKETVVGASKTIVDSHTKLIQEMTQVLEERLTDNLTSALEQFGKETRRKRILHTDDFHKNEHKFNSNATAGRLLAARKVGTSGTEGFSEGFLAKIVELLRIALRRVWLALAWLLPLVSGFIAHLTRNIPRQLSQPLQDSIRFEDALGRVQLLAYEQFKYWEVFQAMLKCTFSRLPGEANVKAGLYFIQRARRPDRVITKETWERSVMPGTNINMSILLVGVNSSDSCCPRCNLTSECAAKSIGVKCQECKLEYCIRSKADLEKCQDEIAKRFLKLAGLGANHVDAGLNRRSRKLKVTRRRYFGDSENEDYDYPKGSDQTKKTQLRVKNDAQEIDSFKRIHTLIDEKKNPSPDLTLDTFWNLLAQDEQTRIKEFWLDLGPKARSSLVNVEKDISCSCAACLKRRTTIEKELEVLYDAYYEGLELYSNSLDDVELPSTMKSSHGRRNGTYNFGEDHEPEEYSTEEDEDDGKKWIDDQSHSEEYSPSRSFAGDFQRSRICIAMLMIADALLDSDRRSFIEMMNNFPDVE